MKRRFVLVLLQSALLVAVTACGASEAVPEASSAPTAGSSAADPAAPLEESDDPEQTAVAGAAEGTVDVDDEAERSTFRLDAWSDNWFAAYLGEELIVEDSVPITTERSFNAESVTFEASYPLQLNVILKDFIENDTGLEYIGSNRQQMGDGGFIMQLTDLGSGAVVAVSDARWACTVVHQAPLDKACELESNPVAGTAPCEFVDQGEPEGWKATGFDDSTWTATTVHSAGAVDPKGGYDEVSWNAAAEFIWGPDLETNNTLLCRVTVSEQ